MSRIWQEVNLPVNVKMVLLKLADHADDDGRNAWPSIGRLAHNCGLSERSVYRILRQLQGEGWADSGRRVQQVPERDAIIFALANDGGGRGKSVSYFIDIEKAKERYPLAPYTCDHRTSCPVAQDNKGAASAPFTDEKGDRESSFIGGVKGDSRDQKGDICGTKRVTPVSPQPSYESPESPSPPLLISPQENPSVAELEKAHGRTPLTDIATWQPDEPDCRYAEERRLDPERVLQDMRDWVVNAQPRQQRKRDPHAFWRSWCRREADRLRSPPSANGSGHGQRSTAIREAARRVAARRG